MLAYAHHAGRKIRGIYRPMQVNFRRMLLFNKKLS